MNTMAQFLESNPEIVLIAADIIKMLFAMAFGACLGSLINVIVYRVPLGLDIVSPPSRCPSCETLLTWRENIPVFGWLALRGRCRFCRATISPEYPLVELYVALLFGAAFMMTYADPATPWYASVHPLSADWGQAGFMKTWPVFVVVLMLFASLVAMFLTDAKTFQIPMMLTWVPTILAFVGHGGFSLWIEFVGEPGRFTGLPGTKLQNLWSIATPGSHGWWWIGAALGGGLGVVMSNLLVRFGIFSRSFSDYEKWEREAIAQAERERTEQPIVEAPESGPVDESKDGRSRTRMAIMLGGAVLLAVAAWGWHFDSWLWPSVVGIAALIHILILAYVGQTLSGPMDGQDYWIRYPFARREMLRELIFIAPIVGLALLGGSLAYRMAGPWELDPVTLNMTASIAVPDWLRVMGGVILGYLVGGGLIWGVRILGTLAFDKEAMGLGDVHLLGAVGACLGWIDAVGTFFAAVVIGAIWGILGSVMGGSMKRMLPFGPFLALGALLIWFGKQGMFEPLIEAIVKIRVQLP